MYFLSRDEMVDVSVPDYSIFVPRNLSCEEYFPTQYQSSILYEALQLCESSTSSFSDKSKTPNHKLNERWYIRRHATEPVLLDALDLASSHFSYASRKKRLFKGSKHLLKTVRSHSNSETSESGTVFSENESCLSDAMEEYLKEIKSKDSDYDNDCDSAMGSSGLSSASTVSSDLDRVTVTVAASRSTSEFEDKEVLPVHNTPLSDVKRELRTLLTAELSEKIKTALTSDVKTTDNFPHGYTEDDEFDYLKKETRRRSTSLKTNKTPPGTPGRKKAVRFADALGLDLEDVRHIMNTQDPPQIPASAMKDLKVSMLIFVYVHQQVRNESSCSSLDHTSAKSQFLF